MILTRIFKNPFKTRRRIAISAAALVILVSISAFLYVKFAYGVTRTWDGECGGDTSWSCAANWSGDTQPGSSDLAQFDTFDGDSTIDASYAGNVGGVQITANYDGTITQSRSLIVGSQNFAQAGGIWNGGAQTFDINDGSFTVSGGVHTATTGTWTLEEDFTYSSGTLTMTGATVTLDGSNGTDISAVSCTGTLGGIINIAKTGGAANAATVTIGTGCTVETTSVNQATGGAVTINGTMHHTGSTFNVDATTTSADSLVISSTGTLTYSGTNITLERNFTQNGIFDMTGITVTLDGGNSEDDSTIACSGTMGGTVNIAKAGGAASDPDVVISSGCTINVGSINTVGGSLTVNGTMNHTGSTFNMDTGPAVSIANLIVAAGGTVTYSGTTITLERGLTQNGTFNLSGITITFDGGGSEDDSTITCSGTLGGTVNLAKSGGVTGNPDTVFSSGCTINVGSINTVGGSITVNGVVHHTGSTFNIDHGSSSGATTSLNIMSGAVVTFSGTTITMDRNFTQNGTFDLTGITVSLDGGDAEDDATLTCGSPIGGNITINKTNAGANTVLGSSCTIAGDFTRTDGPFSNPASPFTLTVQGNFSMATTDAFGGNNLTLVMSGTQATQTMTQSAGTINNNIQVHKSSGTASLSTALTTNGTATVSAGIFDLNSRTFTAGQGFLVTDGGTLELYGSETTTAPTLNSGSTVKYTGDGDSLVDAYTLKDYTYYHLTIASVDSGDTYATPNATEDALGNFVLSGGVFTAPSGNFTIGGNFTHSGGTFTHGSGTIVLNDSSQTSAISGSSTFNNLSSTTAGKKITVANGTTQTVGGTFTLTGSAGNRIRLTGAEGGSQWDLVATGQSVSYVEARDSDASGGSTITATNSVNLGNNTNWTFTQSNPNEVKMQRGVNIQRGTNIQRN